MFLLLYNITTENLAFQVAETVLGPHQLASDVFSSDLTKNRYFGFPPYVKYRQYCSGKLIREFEDLLDIIDPEVRFFVTQHYVKIFL